MNLNRRATVLRSKLEIFIFEEAVHQDDEFAHASGQGDQRLFARSSESLIKGFEDAIMFDGAHRGHVEGAAHGDTPAADVPRSVVISAVSIIRSQAGQRRGRRLGELAQFGHLRQHRGGNDRTDSGDGLQPFGFVRQLSIRLDKLQDGLVAGFNLAVQQAQALTGLAAAEGIDVMFSPVAFSDTAADKLPAARGQFGESLLLGGRGRSGRGPQSQRESREHGGINRIGFGALTLGPSEVTDASGFDHTDGHGRGMEGT
jgi:hypothetical protein